MPVAAAVTAYRSPGFYGHIDAVGAELYAGLNAIFERRGVPGAARGLGRGSASTSG